MAAIPDKPQPFFGSNLIIGATPLVEFKIISGSRNNVAVGDVDGSHTQSPNRTKEYASSPLIEGGDYSFEIIFPPEADEAVYFGIDDQMTIEFPITTGNTTPTKKVFNGYVNSQSDTYPLEERMTATIGIKVGSQVVTTPGAP